MCVFMCMCTDVPLRVRLQEELDTRGTRGVPDSCQSCMCVRACVCVYVCVGRGVRDHGRARIQSKLLERLGIQG